MDERILGLAREFLQVIAPIYGDRLDQLRVAEMRSGDDDAPPGARLIVVLKDAPSVAHEIRTLARAAASASSRWDLDAVPDLFIGEEWSREGIAARACSIAVAA